MENVYKQVLIEQICVKLKKNQKRGKKLKFRIIIELHADVYILDHVH